MVRLLAGLLMVAGVLVAGCAGQQNSVQLDNYLEASDQQADGAPKAAAEPTVESEPGPAKDTSDVKSGMNAKHEKLLVDYVHTIAAADGPEVTAAVEEPAPEEEPVEPAFAAGKRIFEAQEFAKAVKLLREGVLQEPKNPEAYYYLGRAYHANRQTAEAAQAYRLSMRLDDDYMWPHYDLGRLLADDKQTDAAIVEFRRAIELKSDYIWSHMTLGKCLSTKGDHAGAVRSYEAAVQIDPKNLFALQTLAGAYSAKGDKDSAVSTYEKMERASGDDAVRAKVARDAITKLRDGVVVEEDVKKSVTSGPASKVIATDGAKAPLVASGGTDE